MKRHRQSHQAKPARHWVRRLASSLIIVLLIGYLAGTYLARPAEGLSIQPLADMQQTTQSTAPTLAWPAHGQAAVATTDQGILATHGQIKSAPIASVAKLMTALSVMQKRPLSPGHQGPTITITEQDQKMYDYYYVRDGSLAAIKVGEKISQYQALQAMLLPSANNFAYTLARWAFGSEANYVAYANNYAKQIGLTDSHFADASGFNPQTVSSTRDLIKLGQLVLADPVLAKIVDQPYATIPVAGKITNVNWLLGRDNEIIGIKTGNTDQAGGCMLLAAKHQVAGQTITLIVAVMGAPHLHDALNSSYKLLKSAEANLRVKTLVHAGQAVGHYDVPWDQTVSVSAKTDLKAVVWPGQAPTTKLNLSPLKLPAKQGDQVGQISAQAAAFVGESSVDVVLDQSLTPPSWYWRLTHPADTWRLAF